VQYDHAKYIESLRSIADMRSDVEMFFTPLLAKHGYPLILTEGEHVLVPPKGDDDTLYRRPVTIDLSGGTIIFRYDAQPIWIKEVLERKKLPYTFKDDTLTITIETARQCLKEVLQEFESDVDCAQISQRTDSSL